MISGHFPQSHRLRKSSQFQSVSKNSNVFSGKVLFVMWKANSFAYARLGITVTKKFGDAHMRNRFKRVVREVFRKSRLKDMGFDILVKVKGNKPREAHLTYKEIEEDFEALFDRIP